MSFVYLASPYTPHRGESVQSRVDAACRYAAKLMRDGHSVFSPIAHSHYVSLHLPRELQLDHEFWMRQDLAVLRHAEKLIVLCLAGWERSQGIKREIATARAARIPVEHVAP